MKRLEPGLRNGQGGVDPKSKQIQTDGTVKEIKKKLGLEKKYDSRKNDKKNSTVREICDKFETKDRYSQQQSMKKIKNKDSSWIQEDWREKKARVTAQSKLESAGKKKEGVYIQQQFTKKRIFFRGQEPQPRLFGTEFG